MFSATFNILPGSKTNPDFTTLMPTVDVQVDTQMGIWKMSLWIPGVSTITGTALALTGTIHAIVHLACAIFDSAHREQHLEEAKLGGRNIAYGLVAALLPIVGNIAILVKDLWDANEYCKMASQYKKDNESECKDHVILFYDGVQVASKGFDCMDQTAKNFGYTGDNRPGFWDQVKIVNSWKLLI